MNRQIKVILAIAVLYGIGFGVYEFTLPLFLKKHQFDYRTMGLFYAFGAMVQFALENSIERVLDALRKDKKREGEHIHFVFLQGIGDAVVKKIAFSELEALVRETAGLDI